MAAFLTVKILRALDAPLWPHELPGSRAGRLSRRRQSREPGRPPH
jgi:hypothetical protein